MLHDLYRNLILSLRVDLPEAAVLPFCVRRLPSLLRCMMSRVSGSGNIVRHYGSVSMPAYASDNEIKNNLGRLVYSVLVMTTTQC